MSEQRYSESDKENILIDNEKNFSFKYPNEYDPFSELLNNSPGDGSFSNFNDLDVYFHNNNVIRGISNLTIKDNKNEEINNNINDSSEEKYKNNPFVQKKMTNETEISRNEILENDKKKEKSDSTSQKFEKNISQEKQNKNINQYNFILNMTTTQSIEFINNNYLLGKKRERNYDTFTDKYFKKVRTLLIKAIIFFINELIKKFTNNDIGKGICEKQIVDINKGELTHSSVEYDKEFLHKKIKEILSSISKKYTNYLDINNKKIIEDLLNLKDKGEYFQKLFDLSFLDFLEHINGKKNNELLNGFPTIDEIIEKKRQSLSKFDINKLKSCFVKYKDLVENKKSRKSKKNKK